LEKTPVPQHFLDPALPAVKPPEPIATNGNATVHAEV
jgi:hypothetical protein